MCEFMEGSFELLRGGLSSQGLIQGAKNVVMLQKNFVTFSEK